MDFLDSLDLHTDYRKSNRVRSWYLYEQYKSLEKSQLDAARKLKNKSYQHRILNRELSERRARRRYSEQIDLPQSKSYVHQTINSDSRTPFSHSRDSLFERVCEQEDAISDIGHKDTGSQHSETSNFYDEIQSIDNKNNSCSESINRFIEKTEINGNISEDIKDELEFVKNNIAEMINMQIETEKECLEKFTELCEEKSCDTDSLKSTEVYNLESAKTVDKYCPKYDNGVFAIWSKLVAFSYNIMQMNRGNCYYDYSTQFLTGVLAFDVLRRGISRMLSGALLWVSTFWPFVSPIKFATDEPDTLCSANENSYQKHSDLIKSKVYEDKYGPLPTMKNMKKCPFERKYRSEEKWKPSCKYSYENKINERRSASEPWRSEARFSGGNYKIAEPLQLQNKKYTKCTCRQLKKAINPIIKLSRYIDMILQEIEE